VAATAASGDETDEVDFLANLATAVGEDKRVRTAVLLHHLVEINPDEYGDWTFQDLKAALDDAGYRCASPTATASSASRT
jgi:S-DNA-T family DNA segregation ATPase FtsK/SpoIIIE